MTAKKPAQKTRFKMFKVKKRDGRIVSFKKDLIVRGYTNLQRVWGERTSAEQKKLQMKL